MAPFYERLVLKSTVNWYGDGHGECQVSILDWPAQNTRILCNFQSRIAKYLQDKQLAFNHVFEGWKNLSGDVLPQRVLPALQVCLWMIFSLASKLFI